MKIIFYIIVFLFIVALPVSALDFSAPSIPDSAQEFLPVESESFSEGLWYIVKQAIRRIQPSISEATGICVSIIAILLLVSVVQNYSACNSKLIGLIGAIILGALIIKPTNALISLGVQTVNDISEYGKLLLPVMTAALAAQGAITSSTALYTGTVFFNTLLSIMITKVIIPMIYIYICMSIAYSALAEDLIKRVRDFIKWMMVWSLKIVLYVFTGYIGITGVVSGTADASAIKATKLALAGVVPVVGGIISDASETILISAGVMKNAVGIYGLLAMIAIWIGPFIKIAVQYILLKITAGICSVFGQKQSVSLLQDFSGSMGFLLAITGTVCLLFLVSTVCFMKGVS